mgnify:CR=1 FL=1
MFQSANQVRDLKKLIIHRGNLPYLDIRKHGVEEDVQNALKGLLSVVIVSLDRVL